MPYQSRLPLSLWDFSYSRDIDGNVFPFPTLSLATLAALTRGTRRSHFTKKKYHPPFYWDGRKFGLYPHLPQQGGVYLPAVFRRKGENVAIGGRPSPKQKTGGWGGRPERFFFGEGEKNPAPLPTPIKKRASYTLYVQDGFVDLAASPAPRFELLELSAYSTAIIETSRGCPHSCEFCEIPIRLGKRPRNKSVEQVMTEISSLYALGADSIFIIDDNFFGNRKRALIFLLKSSVLSNLLTIGFISAASSR